MPVLTRRGYTVVELMVALFLASIVATAVVKAFALHQRTFSAQTQLVGVQQSLRAGLAVLPAELRPLNAKEGDILKMADTSITIRALRQLAILCQVPALGGASVTLTVRQAPFYGPLFDNTRDGLYVFYEGDESTRSDDAWLPGKITSAPNNAALCSDGKAAYSFTTTLTFGALPAVTGNVPSGAAVRGYRQVTYGAFKHTDGRWYVGMKDSSAAMAPLIGPLVNSKGLKFTYYNMNNAVTTDPSTVARIGISLVGQTTTLVRQANMASPAYKMDSLSTLTTLRNNPRW